MILSREGAKLLDFGLARLAEETPEEAAEGLSHLVTEEVLQYDVQIANAVADLVRPETIARLDGHWVARP